VEDSWQIVGLLHLLGNIIHLQPYFKQKNPIIAKHPINITQTFGKFLLLLELIENWLEKSNPQILDLFLFCPQFLIS